MFMYVYVLKNMFFLFALAPAILAARAYYLKKLLIYTVCTVSVGVYF